MQKRPDVSYSPVATPVDTPTLTPDVAAVPLDDVADLLSGPTSPEPGALATDRQLCLFPDTPVSVVSTAVLRQLAGRKIRRECWEYDFDWDAFVTADRAWRIAEDVRQKAVVQERGKGLDIRSTDIPTDTALAIVQAVITEWTNNPELRPSEAGLSEVQTLRGRQGNDERWGKDADARALRDSQIVALASQGVRNADIARLHGIDRSTVGRILAKANATPPPALSEVVDAPPPFPAPELPAGARWPVSMVTSHTGIHLDGDSARWLAAWGQCYTADGLEDDLADLIRTCAGAKVDPWAYLQTAIANGNDAWTVSAQLLGKVLTSAGQHSLESALTNIGAGHVARPLPYLRTCVANGNHPTDRPDRPVGMAVALARRWAPQLVIFDVATSIAAEEADQRAGYDRLPREPEPPAHFVALPLEVPKTILRLRS